MDRVIEISGIYYNNALKFIHENNISKAVIYIKKSLKLYSKDFEVLNLMGICQYILCDFDKAYFYWNKSIECNDKDNRAKNYLKILKSRKFNRVIRLYNEALEEIKNSQYKEAIEKLNKIIHEEKNLLEPYIIIGLCYYMLGKYNNSKKYIEFALKIDKENEKCLLYLREINDKRNVKIIKSKSNKNYKVVTSISTLLLITLSGAFYKNYNSYIKIKNNLAEYQQKYNINNIEFELIKSKYNKLNSRIQKEQQQIKDKFNEKNDNEIFNESVLYYKNKNLKLALEGFTYVSDKGLDESLVAESTYFSAVCYEKLMQLNKSEEFYCKYINRYKNKNYYDDALYNYGIMLYRQGKKDKAKDILYLLQKEVPNSIFINKTVKMILKN
ncbi:tetratricopeptide repeat protein [Clostridium botulinum C]|uniref:Tetratricopeptide repeat protein n=2 Tax=Clostridium botulinum TaxID=1491 RepID=A0A9Q4XW08_CLOBO|nr:tetratricopeptide repeat protein [Clostridium botulinum]MCD3195567.1 tetratricopeptide repeat protein [Clostridium botulinum C]MCD3200983.1 tetratricopeptide repeat protein [Clostridium botulinum C]MCD3206391.1 tetratricopeptide repeat protein [Clostridium botulinum C]MCD3208843.1 tetratricopeptide repeat protein [Clostridium botulinum C]MCD3224520.1 tetratricopeptide repeat protein [Clostridium botulinum C]